MSVAPHTSSRTRLGLDRAYWHEVLQSVSVVTVTPFAGRHLERIDHDGLARNVRFLREAGVRVVVAGGNTGEFASLSATEAVEVVRMHVRAFDGPVIAGVGYRLEDAITLGRASMDAGAAGLMVHQPIHPYASEEGLVRYYSAIADALPGVSLLLYLRGTQLTPQGMRRLAEIDSIVAVKVGLPDVEWFGRLRSVAPDLPWVCGLAERWAVPFWNAGAIGFTSGIANFAPDLSRDILRSLAAGDVDSAERMVRDLLPLEELRARGGDANNVAVIKAAMDALGLAGGGLRPPLSELPAEDRDELERILRDLVILR